VATKNEGEFLIHYTITSNWPIGPAEPYEMTNEVISLVPNLKSFTSSVLMLKPGWKPSAILVTIFSRL